MLVERAEMLVEAGREAAFAAMMADKGLALLAATEGVLALELGQGRENPDKFMLLVTWATMEAHLAFTRTADFATFRSLVSPFTKGGAMEHFDMVAHTMR